MKRVRISQGYMLEVLQILCVHNNCIFSQGNCSASTQRGVMPSHWRGGNGCACPGTQSCPGGRSCCGGALELSSRNRGYVAASVAPAEGLRSKSVLLCFWCAGEPHRAQKPRAKQTADTRHAIANAKHGAEVRAVARERSRVLRRPSGVVAEGEAEEVGDASAALAGAAVGGAPGGSVASGSAGGDVAAGAAGAAVARRGEDGAPVEVGVGPEALRAALEEVLPAALRNALPAALSASTSTLREVLADTLPAALQTALPAALSAMSASAVAPLRTPTLVCPVVLVPLREVLAARAVGGVSLPDARELLRAVRVHVPDGRHYATLRAVVAVYHPSLALVGCEMGPAVETRPVARMVDMWAQHGRGQLPSLRVALRTEAVTLVNHVARRVYHDARFRGAKAADLLHDAASLGLSYQ